MSHSFRVLLHSFAIASMGLTACDSVDELPKPPNILLVSIDSLRADHLGCYGYQRDTSPALDRFAAEGLRCETALAPTSWTLPSHVTMFTGLPPLGHGVLVDRKALSEDAVCLAEVLKSRGYETAGFVGGPFLRSMHGLAQGFDTYDDETVVRPLLESHKGQTSPALVELARDWISSWLAGPRNRPFFVFLHLWDVHYDYTPPPPFDAMFDPDYTGTITAENFELGDHIFAGMNASDLRHIVALYDGEIRYTDGYVGQLLDFMEECELADETVIAITSDHGEEFFEHGMKGHRKNLYETTLRVPLLIRYPRLIRAGAILHDLARLEDLAPTLFALAGIEQPREFGAQGAPAGGESRDLLQELERTAGASQPIAAFGDLQGEWSAVRTARKKLILSRESGLPKSELFNLVEDPHELKSVEGKGGRGLRDRINEWRAYWIEQPRFAIDIVLDEAQENSLRNLGYIR